MPQGKGTYGSEVGRPKKKANNPDSPMYDDSKLGNVGDVDWFDTPEKGGGAWNKGGKVVPQSNARERTVREYAGGGKVGFNSIGQVKGYSTGGKAEEGWVETESGARIRDFNQDNETSGLNPAIGEAAKKVGKFIKQATKDVGDAIQKGVNKRRGKKIEKTFKKQDKRIAKHKEQDALIAADDEARKKRKAAKKKKKEEEEAKKKQSSKT